MKSATQALTILSIFTLLLNQLHTGLAYTLTSTQLFDLQSTDEASFKAEADSWTASTIKTANRHTICGTTYLLGGYNVLGHTSGQYFQRIYTDLPSHTQINFSLVFWSIDNWTSDDKFELKFDSTLITGYSLSQRTGQTDICGGSSSDLPSVRIDGKVDHSDTSLTFRVISQLTSGTSIESFGIRDIIFTFASPATTTSTEICVAAPITLFNNINTCTCPDGQYEQLTHSGDCAACHASCVTCTGASSSSCTSCSTGKFLNVNECVACDQSCGTCSGAGADKCLTCASGYRKVTGENGKISCLGTAAQEPTEESFLNAPTEAGTATFIVLAKTTQYVRTLDMSMSPRLQLLAASRGREIMSLRYGFQMPSSMQEKFNQASLPTAYEKQGLHSSFLVNYWQELTSQGIILAIGFLLILAELVCQSMRKDNLQKGLQIFRVLTAWNFCFILLATSLGDVIIFSYLEFSTFSSSSSPDASLPGFSLAVCIIVILIMITFLVGTFMLVRKTYAFRRGLLRGEITQAGMVRWDGCRVIYEGYYTRRALSRLFFLIYTIRLGLPSLISIITQSSPIAQTILQLIINITILVFILRIKPIKSRVNHIQLILIEVITFIINIFMVILAIMDTSESENTDAMITLGDIVIVFNFIINLLIIIFMVIKLFFGLKEIRANTKEQTKTEILFSCLHLLAIPLQQGGMGFEQAFEDHREDDHDYVFDLQSACKVSPTHIIFDNSARDITARASIAKHMDDEDPKSAIIFHQSNMYLLPSLADQKSRTSIMKDGMKTEREDTEMDDEKGTNRKRSELPPISTNIDSKIDAGSKVICITDAASSTIDAISRATLTVRPSQRRSKRGKSVPKNRLNPEEDRFYMYKEKLNQAQPASPEKPKKKKKKNRKNSLTINTKKEEK